MRSFTALQVVVLATILAGTVAVADVITAYGPGPAGGGAGTTWSPTDHGGNLTTSGGDLILSASSGEGIGRSTSSKSAGKICIEIVGTAIGADTYIGWANSTASNTSYLGSDNNGYGIRSNGHGFTNNADTGLLFQAYATSDVVTLQVDYVTTPGSLVLTTKLNGGTTSSPVTWTPSTSLIMFVASRPFNGSVTIRPSGLAFACDAGFSAWN